MRLSLIAIAGAAFVAASAAQAQTAGDLLPHCEVLLSTLKRSGRHVEYSATPAGAYCWGYFLAVTNFAGYIASGLKDVRLCPPRSLTTSQLVRAFVGYARSHPEQLDRHIAAVAASAIASTFPCPAQR